MPETPNKPRATTDMTEMEEPDYIRAHAHSSHHREELLSSESCGCFYCLEIFSPHEIMDWIVEKPGEIGSCARCPKCDIDSVIGSASGFPITKEFLKNMQLAWFDMK